MNKAKEGRRVIVKYKEFIDKAKLGGRE